MNHQHLFLGLGVIKLVKGQTQEEFRQQKAQIIRLWLNKTMRKHQKIFISLFQDKISHNVNSKKLQNLSQKPPYLPVRVLFRWRHQ